MRKMLAVVFLVGIYISGAWADFVRDNTLEVVTDTEKNLMWQDDYYAGVNQLNFNDSISYCNNLELASFNDWYLPSLDELYGLVGGNVNQNYKIVNGFINVYATSINSWYWSSKGGATFGDGVNFASGSILYDRYTYKDGYVRCVRSIKFYSLSIANVSNGTTALQPTQSTYKEGSSVVLTATPNSGFKFSSWSDGSTLNPRTITITADTNLTANFIAKTCQADSYNCPTCIGSQTLKYNTDGSGYCQDPTCTDSQKLVSGSCIAKTCQSDSYGCPTCIGSQTLKYNTDGSGYCENPTCLDSQKLISGSCIAKTCQADSYNCPTCIGSQTLKYNTDGSGYCQDPTCTASQKLVSGSCIAKTCQGDSYNCPTCIGSQTLKYNTDGSGYCENPTCTDSQKLISGTCIAKTCQSDSYNCPTCIGSQTLKYNTDGSGYCQDPTCTDSQKLVSGSCVAKTCVDDGYNCPICLESQKLVSGECIAKTCEADNYGCSKPPLINSISTNPTALFEKTPITFEANITLDGSTISSYLWNFGDGSLSTKEKPNHSYEASGKYTISLEIKDSNGLSGTISSEIDVAKDVDINAKFIPSINQALPPHKVNFYDTSTSENSIFEWNWEIKDSTGDTISTAKKKQESSSKNFSYEFDSEGEYTIKLTIADIYGATSTYTQTINMLSKAQDVGDAIILAGLGDNPNDPLYPSMNKLSLLAYKYLQYRGYGDDKIHFMFENSDVDLDNDGYSDLIVDESSPTASKFYDYIKNLATTSNSTKPLLIYMLDHGKKNVFMITNKKGSDGYVYGSGLKEALDTFQSQTGREVILVMEACHSGSFLTALSNPIYNQKRAMFFSSESEELTYIGSSGAIAFSKFFFTNLLGGNSIMESYLLANSTLKAQNFPFKNQNPVFNNTISDSLQSLTVGGDFATAALLPSIELLEDSESTIDLKQKTAFSQTVKVDAIAGVKKIWAVVIPPEYSDEGSESNESEFYTPNLDEYKVTLSKVTNTNYKLEYPPQMGINGEYNVFYYIEDNEGHIETTSSKVVAYNGTSTSTATTIQSIPTGWSMVSLPIDTNISYNELSSKYSQAKTIWKYNNGWSGYGDSQTQPLMDAKGIAKIDTINRGDGFWINSRSTMDIEYQGEGYNILTDARITDGNSGWYLLGSGSGISLTELLNANPNIKIIWQYKNGWRVYSKDTNITGFGDIDNINSGEGFWIFK